MTKSFMVATDPFEVTPFERGLCPRNPILGGGREERAVRRVTNVGRGAKPPSEYHRAVHAAHARASQPRMKARPPNGVMTPSARTPVTASR